MQMPHAQCLLGGSLAGDVHAPGQGPGHSSASSVPHMKWTQVQEPGGPVLASALLLHQVPLCPWVSVPSSVNEQVDLGIFKALLALKCQGCTCKCVTCLWREETAQWTLRDSLCPAPHAASVEAGTHRLVSWGECMGKLNSSLPAGTGARGWPPPLLRSSPRLWRAPACVQQSPGQGRCRSLGASARASPLGDAPKDTSVNPV